MLCVVHVSKVTTCRDHTEALPIGNATAIDDEVGSRYIVTNKINRDGLKYRIMLNFKVEFLNVWIFITEKI